MSEEKANLSIGFVGLLQLTFIILKLCSVIEWTWFWVLFPTITQIAPALIAIIIILIIKRKK